MRKTFSLLSILCIYLAGFSQKLTNDTSLNYNNKDYVLTHAVQTDPALLTDELTRGKSGDLEKFETLFGWVASNIEYDYEEYYSPGAKTPTVKKTLSSKKTICLGYANLMDTLCRLAGLTSVAVYGYTKDDVFDVGDSLYMDNHAWNAVKLNGLWYLYDVTLSSGYRGHKVKGMGNKILAWQKKYQVKYKKKPIVIKNYEKNCGKPYTENAFSYRSKKLNNWWGRFIFSKKIKTKPIFVRNPSTGFYLTQPELFAITHYPDDPRWSLLPPKKITQYESDSAFYYLDDKQYRLQERRGVACGACDEYIGLSPEKQNAALEKSSLALNPRNQFIVSHCEMNAARFKLVKSNEAGEKKTKIMWIDSAEVSIENTKKSLQACKRYLGNEFKAQKDKNKVKQTLLIDENKAHKAFMKEKIKHTKQVIKIVNALGTQISKLSVDNRSNADEIKAIAETFDGKGSKKKGQELIALEKKTAQSCDSINILIVSKKKIFDSLTEVLSVHGWKESFEHDTISAPYYYGKKMREYLMDNYKKEVADMRKEIMLKEKKYDKETQSFLYYPAEKSAELFQSIALLSKERNKLETQVVQFRKDLVKASAMKQKEYEDYIYKSVNERHDDYCWFAFTAPKLSAAYAGLHFFYAKQQATDYYIGVETKAEKSRKGKVDDELKRRLKKFSNITSQNQLVLKKASSDIKKYKKTVTKVL